jgi:hypothetical protein
LFVVFNYGAFPFLQSKSKLIGDVLMNTQNAYCTLPIDAPNHPALVGDGQQTAKKTCINWKL